MRPPICAICGKREKCKLIYFKETKEDKEWYRRAQKEGFVGHPPNAEWFCDEHYPDAAKLAHLTLKEAMAILERKYGGRF